MPHFQVEHYSARIPVSGIGGIQIHRICLQGEFPSRRTDLMTATTMLSKVSNDKLLTALKSLGRMKGDMRLHKFVARRP